MRAIKLWDGWQVDVEDDNGTMHTYICKSPSEVWELFGWDIVNDRTPDKVARDITTLMFLLRLCRLDGMV